MGTFEDIRPLTPTPSYSKIDRRRRHRKQREDKPENRPRQQPEDGKESPDTPTNHIDEYV